MRRLEFDAQEFPDPVAEEHLALTLEKKGRTGDLNSFLAKSMGVEFIRRLAPGSLAFVSAYPGTDVVLEHLRNFAGLPDEEARSASLAVIRDEWNERVFAAETSNWFVLYQWTTTA